ncbi:MAG: O-antigen ligase family protein [bacterium]
MDKVIFSILLVGWLLGQVVQIPIAGRDIPIMDIAVALTIAIGGVLLLLSKHWRELTTWPIFWAWGIFIVIALVSLLVGVNTLPAASVVGASLFWVRLALYGCLPWVIFVNFKSDPKVYQGWLLGALVAVSVIGFLQLGLFPTLEPWEMFGWDPHRYRLFATWLDPNFLGIWLALGLGLALIKWPAGSSHQVVRMLTIGLIVAALGWTVSRSALITAVVALLVWAAIYYRKLIGWLGLVVLVGAILLVSPALRQRVINTGQLGDTVGYRIESWARGWQTFTTHPWLGVGYNMLPYLSQPSSQPSSDATIGRADSGFDGSLLTIAATTGAVGLTAWLWFVWQVLVLGWQGITHRQLFGTWLLIATAGLLVGSLFINAWLYSPILSLWLVGLGLSLRERYG